MTPSTTLNKTYLEKLTPEQLIAATGINGPMMVIAGPGTGKTQVISARIAYILENTDTKPENILVLTFTDSGTIAVRKRLKSFIGNTAYYVNIYTFHSFAESIIERYKNYFSSLGEQVIGDIDQIKLIRKILDDGKFDRLKLLDDPYYYTRDILRSIGTLKKEAVTPDLLFTKLNSEIIDLRDDPQNFNKRTNKLKVEPQNKIKSLEKTLELVDIYKNYQDELLKSKKHDYDDMISSVLDEIKRNDELRADLQERYQYFLVDEYQDTNGAQNQIVDLLSANIYGDDPDLFVVGDDDQSIYRFQGASLANVLFFHKKYPNAKIVTMNKSHRSTQVILDGAMSVIVNNNERLVNVMGGEVKKDLVSEIKSADSTIEIDKFDLNRYEDIWIVNKIKELVKSGTEYSDIAVLFRKNATITDFSALLLSHGIPITSDKSSNILDDTDIANLISLIRCIANPADDVLFYQSMCQKWTDVKPTDVVKFSILRNKRHVNFFTLALDVDTLQSEGIAGGNKTDTKDVKNFALFANNLDKDNVTQNKITLFAEKIAELNGVLQTESFLKFFDILLKQINFTDKILTQKNRLTKLNRLATIFDEIKSHGKDFTYQDFLNYIDIVEEFNMTIPEKIMETESNSVKIMTAHRSKGLEYKIVFIPKCIDKDWGNPFNRTNITLPENIIGDNYRSKDEKNEDERRLFYVAMTRAKDQIYISYSDKYENADGVKETMPSIFVSELDPKIVTVQSPEIQLSEQDVLNEFLIEDNIALGHVESEASAHLQKNNSGSMEIVDDLDPDEKIIIQNAIEDLKMNATGLNNFLQCPRKFYYGNLLRIPQLKKDRQSFGTAMHKALENFHSEFNEKNILPSKEFFIEQFEQAMDREIVSEESREKLLAKGKEGLSGYYDKYLSAGNMRATFTEMNFDKRNVRLDNIKITGKLDAICISKDNEEPIATVVDYKTGKIKSHNEVMKFTPNADGELIPSANYTQLMFYKILTDADKTFKYKVKSGVLDYIEGKEGKYNREEYFYQDDEVQVFKDIIKSTYEKIQQMEFPKIKKGKICEDCAFNKICWGG